MEEEETCGIERMVIKWVRETNIDHSREGIASACALLSLSLSLSLRLWKTFCLKLYAVLFRILN